MKKGKIRFTALITSIIMIFSLSVSNVHAYTNTVPSHCLEDNKDHLGKIIPSEVSEATFSDKVDYNSLDELQYKRSISVSGDNLSVSLSLLLNSLTVQLNYDGKLYKSFRYTDEKPVYIGVFESGSTAVAQSQGQIVGQTNNLDIIYFEISNDNSPYNLNQNLRGTSSMTMYLRSEDGTIYDLGSAIMAPVILDGVVNQAPSDNDINWFVSYFNGVYREEPNRSTRSTHYSTWVGDTHTLTYQVAGYEHMFLAAPYIDFVYGDVASNGDTGFGMALKMTESHKYRLVGAGNWTQDTGNYTKCFVLDNAQLTWTAGANTRIKFVQPNVNADIQGGGTGLVCVIASVAGIFPSTATYAAILSAADAILGLSTGTQVTFQNGGSTVLSDKKVFKMRFPTEYYISESASGLSEYAQQKFELVATMATADSSQTRNVSTYAVADFRFKISWADVTGQSGSKVYEATRVFNYLGNC